MSEKLKKWLPFEEAIVKMKSEVKKYKIVGSKEWKEYCRSGNKPHNIPATPDVIYKDSGWVSIRHWLGNENTNGLHCSDQNHNVLNSYPKIVDKYWDYSENIKSPLKICPGSSEMVKLKCDKGHEWTVPAYSLRKIKGCPSCLHKKIIKEESFGYLHPTLLRRWNYSKNKISPFDVYSGSSKKIWLKCNRNHEWPRRIHHVVLRGDGCPYCTHELPSPEYNASILYPELAEDRSPKNTYKLEDCTPSSSKSIKWICHICNYEWTTRVADRTVKGHGCPSCWKIKLRDGTLCDSMIEAYYCLMLRQSDTQFELNHCYPGLQLRYDFYIPSLRLYIEVTSYNGKETWWDSYIEKINRKRKYVEQKLGCSFEFINRQLSYSENRLVKENMA